MPFDYETFERELDALGEDEVRARYRRDEWIALANRQRLVQDWLRSKDDARRDALEEEIKSIARSANREARLANIIAAIAAITAIAVAIFK